MNESCHVLLALWETEHAAFPSSTVGNIRIYPVTDIYLLQEKPIFHSLYKDLF